MKSSSQRKKTKSYFGNLSPNTTEQMDLFPAYPKSHADGYASVIELPKQIANAEGVTKLRDSLQYSLTGGYRKGKRKPEVVKNFLGEGEVKMTHHVRQCAGVKVCEYLSVDLKKPHTEVDLDDLEWAKLLAEQERAEAASYVGEIATIHETWVDHKCDKYEILGGKCGGRTVVGSLKATSGSSIYTRLFIGCEKWTPRSQGHTFVSLTGFDPTTVLQMWGKDRCYRVSNDFKEMMDGKWDDKGLGILLTKDSTNLDRISKTLLSCCVFKFARK